MPADPTLLEALGYPSDARVERRHRLVMATLHVVCPTAFFALGWYIGGVVTGLVLVAFWSLMAATNWLYRLARGEI